MIQIITGIIALGVVILIHEAGHFVAARLCGVTVESFSLGWGPVIFRKKIGITEYRISALPLGGYCGMKGETAFRTAVEKKLESIPCETGSFYSVHPLKRILIAFAGPFFNLLLAICAFALMSASGYTYQTYDNRIIPASRYGGLQGSPADKAGLLEGDRILKINDAPMQTFSDIQQFISVRPEEDIIIEFERNSRIATTTTKTLLDKQTASGLIGVYPYIPLEVGKVIEGSAAHTAGIKAGDKITSVNGNTVSHYQQFATYLTDKPEQIKIQINRSGIKLPVTLILLYNEDGTVNSGINFKTVSVEVAGTGLIGSIVKGVTETVRMTGLTVKSIFMLFRGVDVTKAVSGPVRITMMIGEAASNGFAGFAELLSIICISLFVMNLLPIPILDGGLILLSLPELFSGKPIKPIILYYVQFIGIAFILSVFMLALASDISFLSK